MTNTKTLTANTRCKLRLGGWLYEVRGHVAADHVTICEIVCLANDGYSELSGYTIDSFGPLLAEHGSSWDEVRGLLIERAA